MSWLGHVKLYKTCSPLSRKQAYDMSPEQMCLQIDHVDWTIRVYPHMIHFHPIL
jgi:hypothetical protein